MVKNIIDKLQEALTKEGYITRLDTRSGLYRLHVWKMEARTTVETMQDYLQNHDIARVEVRKHKELGVWLEQSSKK